MKFAKRLSALALALSLCGAAALPAYAHDVPNINQTGSISFTMTYDGAAVGGGSLTLYQVGKVAEDDGNYSFALTDAYADCTEVDLGDLSDMDSADLPGMAQTLADYTTEHDVQAATTVQIGSDGTATADGLMLGLYLVMQHQAASGYEAITPFLVSVPMFNEETGKYYYDVDAEPKMGELTQTPPSETTTTPTPNTPSSESGVTPTETISTSPTAVQTTLPQTGQLNWPVPVLTVAGLLLILTGWYLRSHDKREPYVA